MDKIIKEKIKLTTKQILLYFFDGIVSIEDTFNPKIRYKKPYHEYWQQRDLDKLQFSRDIYRLKKQNYIKNYFKGKNKYLELTNKGKEKIKYYLTEKIKIKKPKKWDKKWRIVIFDIPEKQRSARTALARTLKKLGFISLQKSVFVFPFQCYKEINQIKTIYGIQKYVQYVISDRIESEINLVAKFFDKEVIS